MHPGATDQDINNSHAVETACRSPLDGFTDVLGPDGKHYLVPNFLKDPTTFGFHLQAAREEIKPDYAPDGPHERSEVPHIDVAGGALQLPPVLVLTNNEALSLHAEVIALQRTLGISYKDAAHRLYMAELERLKAERRIEHGMRGFREHIDKTLFHEIYPPIAAIDSGCMDDTVPDCLQPSE